MWEELIDNEVWYTKNFIDDNLVDLVLEKIKNSEVKNLDGDEQPHIISKSYYNYNHVKYNIREDKVILEAVVNSLNEILSKIYKPLTMDMIDEKNVLQFTTKTFDPKKSIYNVHTERKDIYGDFVFINYLTNENGGELVLPNEIMLEDHFQHYPKERAHWENFCQKLSKDGQDPYLAGPLAITPKRNTCVVMRVGSAHFVNPITDGSPGSRAVITGWPYANMNWKDKFKN